MPRRLSTQLVITGAVDTFSLVPEPAQQYSFENIVSQVFEMIRNNSRFPKPQHLETEQDWLNWLDQRIETEFRLIPEPDGSESTGAELKRKPSPLSIQIPLDKDQRSTFVDPLYKQQSYSATRPAVCFPEKMAEIYDVQYFYIFALLTWRHQLFTKPQYAERLERWADSWRVFLGQQMEGCERPTSPYWITIAWVFRFPQRFAESCEFAIKNCRSLHQDGRLELNWLIHYGPELHEVRWIHGTVNKPIPMGTPRPLIGMETCLAFFYHTPQFG